MASYRFRVEVTPQYLPEQSRPEEGLFAFAYTVSIHNVGDIAAQVISRTWHINDSQGLHEKVKGLGVVGHQPLLQPGESFEYTSGSAIATPVGTMRGTYQMMADDGTEFDVTIPPFTLSMPRVLH